MSNSEGFLSKDKEKLIPIEIDILRRCKNFFTSDPKYIQQMLSIINGESDISIRVLDWFVANYSKKYNTTYKIKVDGSIYFFNVNIEYKHELNSYSKHYFDPFCRKKKGIYTYFAKSKNKSKYSEVNFITSIGQLNFFHWAIKNKVIRYVSSHLKEIENDMKETTKQNRLRKIEVQTSSQNTSQDESDSDPDPEICSLKKINIFKISSERKTNKTDSDKTKPKIRTKLSNSVFEHGIKKSTVPITLDFDNDV